MQFSWICTLHFWTSFPFKDGWSFTFPSLSKAIRRRPKKHIFIYIGRCWCPEIKHPSLQKQCMLWSSTCLPSFRNRCSRNTFWNTFFLIFGVFGIDHLEKNESLSFIVFLTFKRYDLNLLENCIVLKVKVPSDNLYLIFQNAKITAIASPKSYTKQIQAMKRYRKHNYSHRHDNKPQHCSELINNNMDLLIF